MALASKMPFLWLVVPRLLQQVVLSVHFWLHSKPCAKHDLEQCTQMLVSNTCLWVTLMIVAHFFEITERQAYRDHSDYVMLHSHLYVDTLRKNEAKEHRNEEAYTQLQEKYKNMVDRNEKLHQRLQGIVKLITFNHLCFWCFIISKGYGVTAAVMAEDRFVKKKS